MEDLSLLTASLVLNIELQFIEMLQNWALYIPSLQSRDHLCHQKQWENGSKNPYIYHAAFALDQNQFYKLNTKYWPKTK